MADDAAGISVLILTQNSERTLPRALASVRGFEEIVVMDGGSADRTEAIARAFENVRFCHAPFAGLTAQRNRALEQARQPWVLVVDSDEAVTPELREALRRVVSEPQPKRIYRMLRTEYFMGRPVTHGAGRGVYQARFFQREGVRYAGTLHEYPVLDGEKPDWKRDPRVGQLPEAARLLHDPEAGVAYHVRRLPSYAIPRAELWIAEGRRSSPARVLRRFLGKLWQEARATRPMGARGLIRSLLVAVHFALVELMVYEHSVLMGEPGAEGRS